MNLSGTCIDSVQECAPLDKLILDLDSSVSQRHGKQQGSAYNGHFERNCYHHCTCSTSSLFAAILERIRRFGVPQPLLRRG